MALSMNYWIFWRITRIEFEWRILFFSSSLSLPLSWDTFLQFLFNFLSLWPKMFEKLYFLLLYFESNASIVQLYSSLRREKVFYSCLHLKYCITENRMCVWECKQSPQKEQQKENLFKLYSSLSSLLLKAFIKNEKTIFSKNILDENLGKKSGEKVKNCW